MEYNFTITKKYREIFQVMYVHNSDPGEPDNDLETQVFASQEEAQSFIDNEDIYVTQFIKITDLNRE